MAPISKNDLLGAATRFFDGSPVNYLDAGAALRPDLAGMRFFGAPLLGAAAAGDPLFEQMKDGSVVGPLFMSPGEWLPGARTVLSFFCPFDGRIVAANRGGGAEIPPEWLHGRIEGQVALGAMLAAIQKLLSDSGFAAVVPMLDERYTSAHKTDPLSRGGGELPDYTSSWSERHVAYICGLGTFGLSRGLITKLGTAGRFGSIITDMPVEADARPYSRYDEYCTMCGECAAQCPVGAIDVKKGKDMAACADFLQSTRQKHDPRYGCGKCNVGVPCAVGIPGAH